LRKNVRLFLARDAQADAERLFADVARAYALAAGLRADGVPAPAPGRAASDHYEEVGSLALAAWGVRLADRVEHSGLTGSSGMRRRGGSTPGRRRGRCTWH